jgi:adenosylcobinamide-phosphate synthase
MSFMSNIVIVVLAYLIDKKFGEFSFIKDPMIMINDLVNFVEKKVYKDSVSAGILFVVTVLGIMGLLSITLTLYLSYFNVYIYIIVSSFIASVFISQNELQDKRIAALLYLLLFGVAGIILYKTFKAMYITVKLKNNCSQKFAKTVIHLDRIISFLPMKITALYSKIIYKSEKVKS